MTAPLPLRSLALLLTLWLVALPAAPQAQGTVLPLAYAEAAAAVAAWNAGGPEARGARLAFLPAARSRALPAAASAAPEAFALQAPFPNPFQAETAVRFSLAEAATVRLEAYDALGRRVATIAEGTLSAGPHTATFDGSSLPPGLYLIRLSASGPSGERTATRRAVRAL